MTKDNEGHRAEALRIMVPGDERIAPGFLSLGRESAFAQATAAFRRINRSRDHGR